MLALCIAIFTIILYIGIMCFAAYLEWRDYNRGICPCCGSKLKYTFTDSQGGRSYMCEDKDCTYTCWVSYPVERIGKRGL